MHVNLSVIVSIINTFNYQPDSLTNGIISFEVRFKDSLNAIKPLGAMGDLVDFVKEQHATAKKMDQPCSGIIYVHKREDCQSIASQLSKVRLPNDFCALSSFEAEYNVQYPMLHLPGDWAVVCSLPCRTQGRCT